MLLTEVSKHIECLGIYNLNKKKFTFNNIQTNSKNVKKLSIFAINNKKKIKNTYINDAIDKGAVGILSNKYIKNINLTQFIVKNIDESLYILLNKLKPFKPLRSLAITGTNGKTSVAWYISQICFNNKIKAKSYGTLGYFVDFKKKSNSILTTPEFEILHQTGFSKKKNLYNYIFEVSSHAIDQNRLRQFPVNIAAITNVTQDHLDYHKNFKNYKETKFKLFSKYLEDGGIAVLNDKIIDINLLKEKLIKKQIITYGLKTSDVNLFFKKKKLKLKFFNKEYNLKYSDFSIIELENISCAIASCFCINIKIKNILNNVNKIILPPGRLEKVKIDKKKYNVYVDYAHTPDALKKILIIKTVKNNKPNLVFGCGGNRDKDKRIKMGLIANKYANRVYVTDDNPRDEDPFIIRKSILEKCKKGIEISNRKDAITQAIKDLKHNEILIIAGKGHEKTQIIKKKHQKFDDLEIAKIQLIKK